MTDTHRYAAAELKIGFTMKGEKLHVTVAGVRRSDDGDVCLGLVRAIAPSGCSVSAIHNYLRAVVSDALLEPETLTIRRNLEAFEPE